MNEILHTDFAPANRVSASVINEQKNHFINNPLISQILNSIPSLVLVLNKERQIVHYNSIVKNFIGNTDREFAAAENGDLQLEYSNFNSLDLINEIINVYNSHEAGKNKIINIDPETVNIIMFSDKTLVRRVLGNLLKNALEASSEEDVITISASLPIPGSIEFWVHNKKFIPRNDQLQIFQRSFSTKGTGRGIGTYSIKLLSEKYLQGRASFISTPENGTTFFVAYPLYLQ